MAPRTFRWLIAFQLMGGVLAAAGCGAHGPGAVAPVTQPADPAAVLERRSAELQAHSSPAALAQMLPAIRQAQDLLAANLANARTTAYKAARPLFADDGRRVVVQRDTAQGRLENSGGGLDVAISGDGFLCLSLGDGRGRGYTRMGSLWIGTDGRLHAGSDHRVPIEPAIVVPPGVATINVTQDGVVCCQRSGRSESEVIGQIQLARFPNEQELRDIGNGVYVQTPESGKPVLSTPGHDGAGIVCHGFLEASNVETAREEAELERLRAWYDAIVHRALGRS